MSANRVEFGIYEQKQTSSLSLLWRAYLLFGGQIDTLFAYDVKSNDPETTVRVAAHRWYFINPPWWIRFLTKVRCPGCRHDWLMFRQSQHEHFLKEEKRMHEFMRACGVEKIPNLSAPMKAPAND